ncbi:MAG TPA: TetR family transcriptional regulator C-terminal domain-containing protein, partial [Halococcus sp.]|nr:TetR family transcriptional regulator C-terminal domain-containing protein [Halococcus sp.]
TIARIGEEFDKSVSLVYHHYDGKDELLVDFLEFMLERFTSEVTVGEYEDAHEQLRASLSGVRSGPLADEQRAFVSALTELRAQAAHDPAYREQFEKTDEFFRERVASVVRAGIEQGVFREVDPEQVADMLVTTVNGALLNRVTTDAPVAPTFEELDAYIELRLLADDAES